MHGVKFFSKRHYGRRRLNAVSLFLVQGCTNSGLEVAVASAFYTVVPNVCVYSVWNLLRITFLVPRIFMTPNFFGKFVHPCCRVCVIVFEAQY